MKGTMVTIPADEAQSLVVEQLSRPPDLMDVYKALGGSAEQVAYLTSYEHPELSPYEHVGTLVRCVAFRNREATRDSHGLKERAQNIWMKSLLRQRSERTHRAGDVLCGSVVVLFGDGDFLGTVTTSPDVR